MVNTDQAKRFFLFHTLSDTTIGELNWTQTRSLCQTLSGERVKDWYIYTKDFGDWRPLNEEIFDFVKLGGIKYTFETPKTDSLQTHQQKAQRVLEEIGDDRRDSPRHKKTLPVILDFGGSLIDVKTEDISVSGLKLQERVPSKDKPKYIMAMIKTEQGPIDMKLAPLHEVGGHFQSVECVGCSNMKAWESEQKS